MRKYVVTAGILLALTIGLELILYRQVSAFTSVARKSEPSEPRDLLLPANDITFRSPDGADLFGWLIQGKPNYPVLIIGHDYGSNRSLTLVKLEGLITALNKQGYFIFLFDFRGHGKSDSASGLGYLEEGDLSAAVKAVLRYKQIAPRIGVLGIGMGAVAAAHSFQSVDEVKCLILDSIYDDIPKRYAEMMLGDWPWMILVRPVVASAVALNLKFILNVNETDLTLNKKLSVLYPKAVIYVEKSPLRKPAKQLYDSTREPKELLLLRQTAAGELLGEDRENYVNEVSAQVLKYLPPNNNEKTLTISR